MASMASKYNQEENNCSPEKVKAHSFYARWRWRSFSILWRHYLVVFGGMRSGELVVFGGASPSSNRFLDLITGILPRTSLLTIDFQIWYYIPKDGHCTSLMRKENVMILGELREWLSCQGSL
ncbi:hypothetical protein L6452_18076 [Arctium lappa]|uniref:Uncharacterized protein n=1 Tax=Arctium lappa TaxID=4217 RepID=A0ACB9C5B0_ARCLA|nr:hypothetical protein L6452_18076 [Arctium lappa]